jgi:hypothetical protein
MDIEQEQNPYIGEKKPHLPLTEMQEIITQKKMLWGGLTIYYAILTY